MRLKLLATAAVALAMLSGPVIAQEAPTTPPNVDSNAAGGANPADDIQTQSVTRGDFASDAERAWYAENTPWLTGFFTDDTMTTAKSEADMKETFAAMDADSQAGMKAACDKAAQDRGNYGSVTLSLCSAAGVM